jgi:hypothetical protein
MRTSLYHSRDSEPDPKGTQWISDKDAAACDRDAQLLADSFASYTGDYSFAEARVIVARLLSEFTPDRKRIQDPETVRVVTHAMTEFVS